MLAILGVIFLVILVKFIYDNFLSNNAAETSEWYRKKYPEEAYRLDNNRGLNMNVKTKSNFILKHESAELIAQNMGTTIDGAKKVFISKLSNEVNSTEEKLFFLRELKESKIEEASSRGIDPDDGVSAVMEGWAIEYFSSSEFKDKLAKKEEKNIKAKQNLDQATSNVFSAYPDLQRLVNEGDREKIMKYLRENPQAFDAWMNHLNRNT